MMTKPLPSGHPLIRKFALHFKHFGSHLLLTWCGRPLEVDVQGDIGHFLQASSATQPSLGPIVIGLRLVRCLIDASGIASLASTLAIPTIADGAVSLCELDSIRMLDLSDNPLNSSALRALAALQENPATRRIDGLVLKKTLPRNEAELYSLSYITAFKDAMVATFRLKTGWSKAIGVSLSLGQNRGLRHEHFHSIREALERGGRPLIAFSIAEATVNDHIIHWTALGHLLLSSGLNASPANSYRQLDVSRTERPEALVHFLLKALADRVDSSIVQINEALGTSIPVFCRVHTTYGYASPQSVDYPEFVESISAAGVTEELQILSVRGKWFEVKSTTDAVAVACWTHSTFVSWLRIGDMDVVRFPYTALAWDGGDDEPLARKSVTHTLIAATGGCLSHLSLRDHKQPQFARYISSALACCPNLVDLNLQGSRTHRVDAIPYSRRRTAASIGWDEAKEACQQLRVLNLMDTKINGSDLCSLPDLPRMKWLSVSRNDIGCKGLEWILRLIQRDYNQLQYVEASASASDASKSFNAMRTLLRKQARQCGLSQRTKLAFVSAIRSLETSLHQCIDDVVVARILQFLGNSKKCVVLWW